MFWMWTAALFGMASSFVESTLAQIFKEQDGKDYVGGLPFYAQKIFGNRKWLGVIISVAFIIYALFCVPIQTFHVFTATGTAASTIAGVTVGRQSTLYYAVSYTHLSMRGDDRPYRTVIDGEETDFIEIPTKWEVDDYVAMAYNMYPAEPAGQDRISCYRCVEDNFMREFEGHHRYGPVSYTHLSSSAKILMKYFLKKAKFIFLALCR